MLLTGCALLAHGAGLMASLNAVRKGSSSAHGRGVGFFLAGIFAAAPFLLVGGGFAEEASAGRAVVWFGEPYPGLRFVLVSTWVFAAWAVAGAYRLMRAELRVDGGPGVWIAFTVFAMAYVAGLVNVEAFSLGSLRITQEIFDPTRARLLVAFGAGLAVLYPTLLAEPKDPVQLRRLVSRVGARDWPGALRLLPRPAIGLGLLGLTVLAVAATPSPRGAGVTATTLVAGSAWLFALRDCALVLALNLAPEARRADAAAFIYLLVLYLLAPAIISALGLGGLRGLFLPDWSAGAVAAFVPPALEAIALWWVCVQRWRRLAAGAA
jgi:hypothetical protein